MFPLLRKRSKKSKDSFSPPPIEPVPPLPRPMTTTAGVNIPGHPLVHRRVRGLPISPPFTKVEFRHRSSPSSGPKGPTHCGGQQGIAIVGRGGAGGANTLSDGTTLANSPQSLDSVLSSVSDRDILRSPSSSSHLALRGAYSSKRSVVYYDADDLSAAEFNLSSYDDKVSYHRWSSSGPSVVASPSEKEPSIEKARSPATSGSSLGLRRNQNKIKGSAFSGSSCSPSLEAVGVGHRLRNMPRPPRRPQRSKGDQKFGVLRWENDVGAGHQRLWIHIYRQDDDGLAPVERIPVLFPPELDDSGSVPSGPNLTHISRPLPHEINEPRMEREPTMFEKHAEELELYRKELEYIATIPSYTPRGPIRPIGVAPPSSASSLTQAACRDLPDVHRWKVTQRNVISIRHSVAQKKWFTGSILGEGTFGRVYLTYNVPHRVELAMKVVYIKRPMSKIVCQGLVNELKVFERLSKPDAQRTAQFVMTPNTATGLWAWQSTEGFLHITSRFCPGGDLYEYIGHLSLDQVRLITAELVLGIEFLHKLGIVHHDLKPENILIDEQGHCVIADYGGSKFLSDGLLIRKPKDEVICTLPYAAPELLADSTAKYKVYDEAIDYWALGATVFMLTTGQELFSGTTEEVKQKHTCVANTLHERMRGYPRDLADLTSSLLVLDPARRLKGPGLRLHPYFIGLRGTWNDVMRKRLGAPIPNVRHLGGHARGFDAKCKNWPDHASESEGGSKTAYMLNVLTKEGLELPYDESFDVPMEHDSLTR